MKKTLMIGIAGATASGKTLLSNTIGEEIDSNRVVVISEDIYYKDLAHMPLEERKQVNFDHPDSLDHKLMRQHIRALKKGKPLEVPTYDFAEFTRAEKIREIKNYSIVVMEGILLFTDPKIREAFDIRIFMDTPLDVCLARRIKRDIAERGRTMDFVLHQYMEMVRPMYRQFIEPYKHYADIIVPRGGANRIAIELIKAKIQGLLWKDPENFELTQY